MSEGKSLAKTHLAMLIWETILVASETTVDTAELAMYELAKNRKYQVSFPNSLVIQYFSRYGFSHLGVQELY